MAKPGFQIQMGSAAVVLLITSVLGCKLTRITIPYLGPIALAVIVTMAAVQALPAYWHLKRRVELRDASLAIPWAFLFWAILPFPADIAARLSRHVPLQDINFVRLDAMFGVHIPAIVQWSTEHWMGRIINGSYSILAPFIAIAFLLPSLTGKVKSAQRFLTGNLIAFIVGLPIFAFLPAIGPWNGYHLMASPLQMQCQSDLLDLRSAGTYIHHANGVICFPSFHVMWAILCTQAVWCFRPLRIPASILSGLIILSTMTTAWHYFVDVIGGILLATIAMAGSEYLYHVDKSREKTSSSGLVSVRMP